MKASINLDPQFILFIACVVVFLSVTVGVIISMAVKIKNSNSNSSAKIVIATVGSMFVAALSWILNMGWLRLILTLLLVPILHGVAFLVSNIVFSKYTNASPRMAKLNLMFIVTYLALYIFMPDGGDVGGMYFLFNLIHNDVLSYIAFIISDLAFAGQILFFGMQIHEIRKIKKTQSE